MAVTERDVRHVAQLARLEVKDAELPSLMRHRMLALLSSGLR